MYSDDISFGMNVSLDWMTITCQALGQLSTYTSKKEMKKVKQKKNNASKKKITYEHLILIAQRSLNTKGLS